MFVEFWHVDVRHAAYDRHDDTRVEHQPSTQLHRRPAERCNDGAIAAGTGGRRISEQLRNPTHGAVRRATEGHGPHAAIVWREACIAHPMREAGVQIERHAPELATRDQDDAKISRARSRSQVRRAGRELDGWEDRDRRDDGRALDRPPFHANEQVSGRSMKTTRVDDRRLQFELSAACEAEFGDERRRLTMRVFVVSIELGACLNLDPPRSHRPRVGGDRRALGLRVVRIGVRYLGVKSDR
jgi:hypothetical protein